MSKALRIATYIVTWTSFLLAIASCILRCYCCKYLRRNWKADDFMSLIVGVFLVGALGLWQRAFSLGCSGPGPNACTYSNPSGDLLTWFFITSIIYDAILHFFMRAAFFTFYLQFSSYSNFRFWVGMGFGMNGMLLIFDSLLIVFQCKPITAAFRPAERMTAHCMDREFALFTPAVLNALLNLYVLILPISTFYSIQLPARRKLYICWVFALGSAAVMLGFIRINSLRTLESNTNTSEGVGEMMIVAALGMSLAAIAHNLPSMRMLWTRVSKSDSKATDTSFASGNVTSKNGLYPSTTHAVGSATYETGSFSRPMQRSTAPMTGVGRPIPALPKQVYGSTGQPRYPVVNVDFGTRPRTPPGTL